MALTNEKFLRYAITTILAGGGSVVGAAIALYTMGANSVAVAVKVKAEANGYAESLVRPLGEKVSSNDRLLMMHEARLVQHDSLLGDLKSIDKINRDWVDAAIKQLTDSVAVLTKQIAVGMEKREQLERDMAEIKAGLAMLRTWQDQNLKESTIFQREVVAKLSGIDAQLGMLIKQHEGGKP
jgi:hypothetical protein